MKWQDYQLDENITKTDETLTLWKTERGIVEASEDTLTCPIRLGDKLEGYVFHGCCKLLLDTIVETDEGATGKSIVREVGTPFLMLGNTEKISEHFSIASQEDLERMVYSNRQEFLVKAEDLLNRFLSMEKVDCCDYFRKNSGLIFAFQNRNDRLDILAADDSRLIYKAKDIVFVQNGNKIVLTSSHEVVCSDNGKSVIIKK